MPAKTDFNRQAQGMTTPAPKKETGDVTYMRAMLVRADVSRLAFTDPHKGRDEYGPLFYGDFAQNPSRYHVAPWLLRELQQRALISTALLHWKHMEETNAPLAAVINAAQMAYSWRVPSDQNYAWNITDKDLTDLSIKPSAFDRLVFLLQAYCLHRAEAEGLTPEATPWLQGLKDYVDAGRPAAPKETISSHILSILIDTTKIAGVTRFFSKVRGPGIVQPLEDTAPQIFADISGFYPLVSIEPRKDYAELPLQFDGTPFILPPMPISEQDVQACLHYDTMLLDDIFNASPIAANQKMQHLVDLYLKAELSLEKYGIRYEDVRAVQDVAALAPKIDLWFRMVKDNDPRIIETLAEWLLENPFTDSVLQEHDLPRGYGELYLQSLAYMEIDKIARSSKPLDMAGRLLLLRIDDLENDRHPTAAQTAFDVDVQSMQDESLASFSLAKKFKAMGMTQRNFDKIAADMAGLPSTYSVLKEWLPRTYSRLYKICPAALPSRHPEMQGNLPAAPQLKA